MIRWGGENFAAGEDANERVRWECGVLAPATGVTTPCRELPNEGLAVEYGMYLGLLTGASRGLCCPHGMVAGPTYTRTGTIPRPQEAQLSGPCRSLVLQRSPIFAQVSVLVLVPSERLRNSFGSGARLGVGVRSHCQYPRVNASIRRPLSTSENRCEHPTMLAPGGGLCPLLRPGFQMAS